MAHPIQTKDFRVLAIGTPLSQELRDEIFAALKQRDWLMLQAAVKEPATKDDFETHVWTGPCPEVEEKKEDPAPTFSDVYFCGKEEETDEADA